MAPSSYDGVNSLVNSSSDEDYNRVNANNNDNDDNNNRAETSSPTTTDPGERNDNLSELPTFHGIPSIPSIPSLTESSSETEEERRRILNDIFAEEEEEDFGDVLVGSMGGNRDGQLFVGGNVSEDNNIDGGNDGGIADDETRQSTIREDAMPDVDGEERNNNSDNAFASTFQQKQQQQQQIPRKMSNKKSNKAMARKRIESESAFSSSSDEGDDDDDDDDGDGGEVVVQKSNNAQRMSRKSEEIIGEKTADSIPIPSSNNDETPTMTIIPDSMAATPKFSNVAHRNASSSSVDDAITANEGARGEEMGHNTAIADDLTEKSYKSYDIHGNFSWIPSVDSSTRDDGNDDDDNKDEHVAGMAMAAYSDAAAGNESTRGATTAADVGIGGTQAQETITPISTEGVLLPNGPTLTFKVSEDSSAAMAPGGAVLSSSSAAAAAAAAASARSATSSRQQPQQQQSAFDRALNEMQKGGIHNARSRSNSFSLAAAGPIATGGIVGIPGSVANATNANSNPAPSAALPLESTNQSASTLDEATTSSTVTDDDDFLAKAEHIVLDEILSENPTDDVESELGKDQDSYASHSRHSMSPSNASGQVGVVDGSSAMDGTGRDSSLSSTKNSSPVSSSNVISSSNSISTSNATKVKNRVSLHTNANAKTNDQNNNALRNNSLTSIRPKSDDVMAGLPDVLTSMRQKIESLNLFDSDMSSVGRGGGNSVTGPPGDYPYYPPSTSSNSDHHPATMMMMDSSTASTTLQQYYKDEEERESMRRSFQQSISAAVLVSLAHKRYERRRLAAMEIEKVVRSLVVQEDYPRVRAILLLLSDDYVRSTNEDARKGGAVALAACAIGLKKANERRRDVMECRDLILASVVHACQDHSQRVRYYATESLFNVTKVIPSLAVQHFFILFEILRSLYADVDLDVRSGAELLDKKLKEVIVVAINSGSFSADACVPVFARFVYMRNKATKQLTLTWLQEFSEKLIGAPILEFLHLFLGGIFAMVADPNATIRQLALEFLQSVLPKLLVNNEDFEDAQQKVDFDKILQSLVLTMEHPDPFVRKVAMYWMSRIVQAHMSSAFPSNGNMGRDDTDELMGVESVKGERGIDISISNDGRRPASSQHLTAASISVRNALPHVLPGILLSIGDTHQARNKDSFLPDHTTHSLAEQANICLQDAVRRDGHAFIPHLGGFIVALREELDSPGGLTARNPPSVERRPYRMDVKPDGSGIESTGWFRASDGVEERDNALILSRLCALQWVVVLFENVVPNSLKAEYASEFIDCIIYQLVDQPPGIIIVKSFEVLAKITIPAEGEISRSLFSSLLSTDDETSPESTIPSRQNPMDDENANFALGILDLSRRKLISRDREVFASLIDLHSKHQQLLMDLSKVIELMCTLQPPEFVFVSFANELDNFVVARIGQRDKILGSPETDAQAVKQELSAFAKDLAFVSNFSQQLGIVFFAAPETEQLREILKDCIGFKGTSVRDERRARLFYILLYTFSHNIVATLSLSLWTGAFLTASSFLQKIDPLDISLMFYLEIDQLIDLIERPLFRHLHLRMLECEDDPCKEGSGAMLFRTLKSIMMLLPQSTSYIILKNRLLSVARFRQSAVALSGLSKSVEHGSETDVFVKRVVQIRKLHCDAKWRNIRAESLEEPSRFFSEDQKLITDQQRREWLGYADEEEELVAKQKMKHNILGDSSRKVEMLGVYEEFREVDANGHTHYAKENNSIVDASELTNEDCAQCVKSPSTKGLIERFEQMNSDEKEKGNGTNPQWREYWAGRQ